MGLREDDTVAHGSATEASPGHMVCFSGEAMPRGSADGHVWAKNGGQYWKIGIDSPARGREGRRLQNVRSGSSCTSIFSAGRGRALTLRASN